MIRPPVQDELRGFRRVSSRIDQTCQRCQSARIAMRLWAHPEQRARKSEIHRLPKKLCRCNGGIGGTFAAVRRKEFLILSSVHWLAAGVALWLMLQGVRSDWGWGAVEEYLIWFGPGGIFAVIGASLPAFVGIQLLLGIVYCVPRAEARVTLGGFAVLNTGFHAPAALFPSRFWGPDFLVAFLVPLAELLWLWRSSTARSHFAAGFEWLDRVRRGNTRPHAQSS
jgi:hypothetical protein